MKEQIYCKPGETLSKTIIDQLKEINKKRKSYSHLWYVDELKNLFQLSNLPNSISENAKLFLGGFIMGEGSINVSAKKDKGTLFGFVLDPEFSLTQHSNGILHLVIALCVFKTGRITYKSGSHATLVFTIDSRQSLKEKVVPFCEKYCKPYSHVVWKERFEMFKELLELFSVKAHLNFPDLTKKMLPIWDKMRKQRDQKNASFASIDEVKNYINEFVQLKKKRSSETTRDPV